MPADALHIELNLCWSPCEVTNARCSFPTHAASFEACELVYNATAMIKLKDALALAIVKRRKSALVADETLRRKSAATEETLRELRDNVALLE